METPPQKRILLVEDDPQHAEKLSSILRSLGHLVQVAGSGAEAALYAQEGAADLALVDIALGGRAGGPAASAEILRRREVPILYLTGDEGPELSGQLAGQTYCGMISKEGTPLLLKSAVEAALELFQARQAALGKEQKERSQLEQSERRLKEAERAAHLGHYEVDIRSGESTWAEEVYRIFGLDPGGPPLTVGGFQKHIHPDDAALVYQLSVACVREHRPYEVDFRIVTESGELRHIHSAAFIQYGEDGTPLRLFGTLLDVTRARQVEDEVRRLLYEKEILLREIHHRIKNNLFTVATLLAMQADEMSDPAAAAALKDARGRIVSMMAIYDRLYRSQDFRQVNLKPYLSELIKDITTTWDGLIGNLDLQAELAEITVESNLAFSLGIILHELLTNACKYAFPRGRQGIVAVQLRSAGERRLALTVSDNGVGIPADVDVEHPATFGLNLVRMLAGQLEAKLEISHKGGTKFQLIMPY